MELMLRENGEDGDQQSGSDIQYSKWIKGAKVRTRNRNVIEIVKWQNTTWSLSRKPELMEGT